MREPTPQERETARQTRQVAFVLAATMILWMGASYLGGRLGWETRFAFLFDLAAMAAFLWALVVTYRIWRKRQGN
jgi:Zn-dependent protease with chaperone function